MNGRVVAVVPDPIPRWICETLREVATTLGQAVTIVQRPTGGPHEVEDRGGSGLRGVYLRLDARRFAEADGPLSTGDIAGLGPAVEIVPGVPREFELGLDLDGELRDEDIVTADRGWVRVSFARADTERRALRSLDEGLAVFTSQVTLVRAAGTGADERTLSRHRSRTHRLSVRRTMERHAAKLPRLVERAVASVLSGAAASVPSARDDRREESGPPRRRSELWRPFRLAGRWAGARLEERLTRRQWFLAASESPDALDRVLAGGVPTGLQLLDPPRDRFWADPFPVSTDRGHFVFVEELLFDRGRAHIACLELGALGAEPIATPVLEEPFHLSYPSVFPWSGDWFMIPESYTAGRLILYKAMDFPGGWEPVDEIPDSRGLVDATVIEAAGHWWLFAVRQGEREEGWDEDLHAFYAPNPMGPWRAHALNPVKIDPVGARPAGGFIRHGSRLIRPGQDNSGRYGRAIVLNEVLELSPTSYRERPFAMIEPEWAAGLAGTHTVNTCPGLLVLDGVRKRSRLI